MLVSVCLFPPGAPDFLRAETVLIHLCTPFPHLTQCLALRRCSEPRCSSLPLHSSLCSSVSVGWTTIQYTPLLLPWRCHRRGPGCLRSGAGNSCLEGRTCSPHSSLPLTISCLTRNARMQPLGMVTASCGLWIPRRRQ